MLASNAEATTDTDILFMLLSERERRLRPERRYPSGNTNKINEFRRALTTVIAVCSRGFGGQSVVGNGLASIVHQFVKRPETC
jgi:hypothetical protein